MHHWGFRARSPCPRLCSIIFENDSEQVAQRVSQRGPDVDTPLAEQSFSQALETAKNQFIRSLQNV